MGWRVWNRVADQPWGKPYAHFPDAISKELNGEKRAEVLQARQVRGEPGSE